MHISPIFNFWKKIILNKILFILFWKLSGSNVAKAKWQTFQDVCEIGCSTLWGTWLTDVSWLLTFYKWKKRPNPTWLEDGPMPPFGSSVIWTDIHQTGNIWPNQFRSKESHYPECVFLKWGKGVVSFFRHIVFRFLLRVLLPVFKNLEPCI